MTNLDNHHQTEDRPSAWVLVEYKLQFEVDETRASIIKLGSG
jgi:hypothetical protein